MRNKNDYVAISMATKMFRMGYKPKYKDYFILTDRINGHKIGDVISENESIILGLSEDEIYDAPTLYDAQIWLLETYNKHIQVNRYGKKQFAALVETKKIVLGELCNSLTGTTGYKTYQEALKNGIDMALKIVSDEKKDKYDDFFDDSW